MKYRYYQSKGNIRRIIVGVFSFSFFAMLLAMAVSLLFVGFNEDAIIGAGVFIFFLSLIFGLVYGMMMELQIRIPYSVKSTAKIGAFLGGLLGAGEAWAAEYLLGSIDNPTNFLSMPFWFVLLCFIAGGGIAGYATTFQLKKHYERFNSSEAINNLAKRSIKDEIKKCFIRTSDYIKLFFISTLGVTLYGWFTKPLSVADTFYFFLMYMFVMTLCSFILEILHGLCLWIWSPEIPKDNRSILAKRMNTSNIIKDAVDKAMKREKNKPKKPSLWHDIDDPKL